MEIFQFPTKKQLRKDVRKFNKSTKKTFNSREIFLKDLLQRKLNERIGFTISTKCSKKCGLTEIYLNHVVGFEPVTSKLEAEAS